MTRRRDPRWEPSTSSGDERRCLLPGAGKTLWLTGLSGAGKSTIAAALAADLLQRGRPTGRLDGDTLRRGLNQDLGFSPADRRENLRRAGEVALLMADAGLVVIASFISPYEDARRALARRHAEMKIPFFEVFIDTPLEVCASRDPKGLYEAARNGELSDFTGVDAPFEGPCDPALRLDGTKSIEGSVSALLRLALDD